MDWANISETEKEKIKKHSAIKLWIGVFLLVIAVVAVIAVVVFEYQNPDSVGWLVPLFAISFIVGVVFVVIAKQNFHDLKYPPKTKAERIEAIRESRNKPTTYGENVMGGIFALVAVIFVIAFLVSLYRTYQGEMDYVCFKDSCSYISPDNYSVNWEGTCLTQTNFGSPVQQCGGTIEITKPPQESFGERLKAAWNKMFQNT
jgi:TRAP-type C4-dicarboxylate transport system permease small subunit